MPVKLDALSACIMVANAEPSDIVHLRAVTHAGTGYFFWRKARHVCLHHLQDLVHYALHANDEKRFPLTPMCRIIAEDYLFDWVKNGGVAVYDIVRVSPANQHQCRHCRMRDYRDALRCQHTG